MIGIWDVFKFWLVLQPCTVPVDNNTWGCSLLEHSLLTCWPILIKSLECGDIPAVIRHLSGIYINLTMLTIWIVIFVCPVVSTSASSYQNIALWWWTQDLVLWSWLVYFAPCIKQMLDCLGERLKLPCT